MGNNSIENLKVNVAYPDGKGGHITTVSDLREKWKQEMPQWRDKFFHDLLVVGKAHSNFGEYTLIKE